MKNKNIQTWFYILSAVSILTGVYVAFSVMTIVLGIPLLGEAGKPFFPFFIFIHVVAIILGGILVINEYKTYSRNKLMMFVSIILSVLISAQFIYRVPFLGLL